MFEGSWRLQALSPKRRGSFVVNTFSNKHRLFRKQTIHSLGQRGFRKGQRAEGTKGREKPKAQGSEGPKEKESGEGHGRGPKDGCVFLRVGFRDLVVEGPEFRAGLGLTLGFGRCGFGCVSGEL